MNPRLYMIRRFWCCSLAMNPPIIGTASPIKYSLNLPTAMFACCRGWWFRSCCMLAFCCWFSRNNCNIINEQINVRVIQRSVNFIYSKNEA